MKKRIKKKNEKEPKQSGDGNQNGTTTVDEPQKAQDTGSAEETALELDPGVDEKAKEEPLVSHDELNIKIEGLEKELTQTKEKYIRLVAEFDNFKRRKEKELMDSWAASRIGLIKKFLPVLDDIDRSLISARQDNDFDVLAKGLELVKKSFDKVLENEKVEAVEAIGTEFNPEIHEAMLQMEKEGVKSNIVVEEHEKGYKVGSKILRPAKVIVSK